MEKELKYIQAVLWERFREPLMKFGMEVEFVKGEQDSWYEVNFSYGKPQTCAIVFYEGKGDTVEEALRRAIRSVLQDDRVPSELG